MVSHADGQEHGFAFIIGARSSGSGGSLLSHFHIQPDEIHRILKPQLLLDVQRRAGAGGGGRGGGGGRRRGGIQGLGGRGGDGVSGVFPLGAVYFPLLGGRDAAAVAFDISSRCSSLLGWRWWGIRGR